MAGIVSALGNRDLVVEVIERLLEELAAGAEWENDNLASFLDAFGALLGSIENVYSNSGRALPGDPWELVARALEGARTYE